MTAPTPPQGWTARRPTGPERCIAEWVLRGDGDAWVELRVFGPVGDRGPRIELHTGPASFGPAAEGPDAVRRLGWALLSGCHAGAAVLEAGTRSGDDPHLTIYDFEELARDGS